MTMKSYEDKMTTLDLISILGLAFHGKRHPLCNKPSWFILPPPSHPPTISSRQQQQKTDNFSTYCLPISNQDHVGLLSDVLYEMGYLVNASHLLLINVLIGLKAYTSKWFESPLCAIGGTHNLREPSTTGICEELARVRVGHHNAGRDLDLRGTVLPLRTSIVELAAGGAYVSLGEVMARSRVVSPVGPI